MGDAKQGYGSPAPDTAPLARPASDRDAGHLAGPARAPGIPAVEPDPGASSPPEPSTSPPSGTGRGAILAPAVMALLALASVVVAALTDLRPPSTADWKVVMVLGVVGIVGTGVGYRFNPPDDDSAPPWDVHTVWLLPAALLTPPSAFGVLVALSIVIGMIKPAHPLRWRIVVASITVLTTVAVHAAALLVGSFALAAVIGIAALWIIGAVAALAVAHVIGTPSGTVLWLDDRWTLIELGCAFSGMLAAGAMRTDPWFGFAALAPLLLAAFALRWPELSWHARIDPKTGLPNAWHWEERTRDLLDAAEARNVPVTVMIIDIDRFKLVNDTYGHLAGDEVLNNLADVLRAQLRRGDLVGRFGGEEFVVTTFGLSPAAALGAAERVRAQVAAQRHRLARARQPVADAGSTGPDTARPGGSAGPGTPGGSAAPSGAAASGGSTAAGGSAAAGWFSSAGESSSTSWFTASAAPRPAAPVDPSRLRSSRLRPSLIAPPERAAAPGAESATCFVTCTIGIASSVAHGYDLTRLLDLADIALAAGKAAGRNQVRDAQTVLAEVGVEHPTPRAGVATRSLWQLALRQSDRRARRHGPGSMFH